VGLDFADNVIDPALNDVVKEIVPTYPIGEILASNPAIEKISIIERPMLLARALCLPAPRAGLGHYGRDLLTFVA
jgi:hypothetical protein